MTEIKAVIPQRDEINVFLDEDDDHLVIQQYNSAKPQEVAQIRIHITDAPALGDILKELWEKYDLDS
ncbi:hypothetical protein [Serratia fonticola]|jgi:hypothetical protein|uniref:hypothetical protein n=1 Tax=Serratia fonticola TaxID=47917 RepID=UPI0021782B28|nr:hypothetical protein [Serratia fonticola]CAI1688103.1 Uncharacterised protein [Serratia fonticola]